MNIKDQIPSIPIDNFKDQHVKVFDLTSMEVATENSLLGTSLRTN